MRASSVLFLITLTGCQFGTDCPDQPEGTNNPIDEPCDKLDFYYDEDGDGYGDPKVILQACEAPDPAWVENNFDCLDSDPSVNPDGTEVFDALDNDCDGFKKHGQLIITNDSFQHDWKPGWSGSLLLLGTTSYLETAEVDDIHIVLSGDLFNVVHSLHISYINTDLSFEQRFVVPDWSTGDVWFRDLNAYVGGGHMLDIYVDVIPFAIIGEEMYGTLVTSDLVVTGLISGAPYDPETDIIPSGNIVGPTQVVTAP